MKDKIVEITNKLNIIINTNNYNIGLQGAMPQRPETPKTEEKVQQQPAHG